MYPSDTETAGPMFRAFPTDARTLTNEPPPDAQNQLKKQFINPVFVVITGKKNEIRLGFANVITVFRTAVCKGF